MAENREEDSRLTGSRQAVRSQLTTPSATGLRSRIDPHSGPDQFLLKVVGVAVLAPWTLGSTACGTSLEPTASSGSWIATSLLSVRLIVSSMLWVACGTETAVITARSPGALAGRTPAELGRLAGRRA